MNCPRSGSHMSFENFSSICGIGIPGSDGNEWSDRHVVGQIMATLIEQTNINQRPVLADSRGI